jgi:hypothetical protein
VRTARKTLSTAVAQNQLQFILQKILSCIIFCGFLLELKAIFMAVIRQPNAESLKAYWSLSCGKEKKQRSLLLV